MDCLSDVLFTVTNFVALALHTPQSFVGRRICGSWFQGTPWHYWRLQLFPERGRVWKPEVVTSQWKLRTENRSSIHLGFFYTSCQRRCEYANVRVANNRCHANDPREMMLPTCVTHSHYGSRLLWSSLIADRDNSTCRLLNLVWSIRHSKGKARNGAAAVLNIVEFVRVFIIIFEKENVWKWHAKNFTPLRLLARYVNWS